jgi:hypothetical protein
VRKFGDEFGFKGSYSIYSGVAHAELAGLWRLFGETGATVPGRAVIYGPVVDPEALFAAAAGTLKSMMGPVERIALLAGWTSPGEARRSGRPSSTLITSWNGYGPSKAAAFR